MTGRLLTLALATLLTTPRLLPELPGRLTPTATVVMAQTTPSLTPAPVAQGSPATAGPSAPAPGAQNSRYVESDPITFDDHAGWVRMFDGSTLTGWDGPTDLWRVENGVIVVDRSSTHRRARPT